MIFENYPVVRRMGRGAQDFPAVRRAWPRRNFGRVLSWLLLACLARQGWAQTGSGAVAGGQPSGAGSAPIGTEAELPGAEPSTREAVVQALRGLQISFNFGSDDGARVGMVVEVRRNGAALLRARVTGVSAAQCTAQVIEQTPDAAALTVGDTVQLAVFAGSEPSGGEPSGAPETPAPLPGGQRGTLKRPAPRQPEGNPQAAPLPTPSGEPSRPLTPLPGATSAQNPDDGANTLGTDTLGVTLGQRAQNSARRTPKAGDYLAALAGLALVLSADKSPSRTSDTAFIADQQFSAISPFPGGGYSVLPSGQLRPGGAFAVNIPLAYAPDRLGGAVSFDVAQNRGNQSLTNSNGRNGTVSAGVGFGVARRPVWLSAMFLSGTSFSSGGDAVYNALVQVVPETGTLPAIALGVQDASNQRERSPFLVATKQLGGRTTLGGSTPGSRPLFATFGLGRGRFSGSTVFGGLSYSPAERVSLSAEYDGLQFNVGAGYALTRRLSVLASYNDLAQQKNRPAGRLGRRYQFGANYGF